MAFNLHFSKLPDPIRRPVTRQGRENETSDLLPASDSPYNNHGVHIIRMRWGKVFDIDANEDSQLVAASLQIWAGSGVNEALADPILS
jgi:hypothetical protein